MNYKVQNINGKIKNKSAQISVPGSKSITARAMLLAAIADGESTLYGASLCDDCNAFLNCLKSLGIECAQSGTALKIAGCGGKLSCKSAQINVGSAGTAARFLTAFLAFQSGKYTVNSSNQMKKRPIAPLVKTLSELGAKFTFLKEENCFPFIIEGTANPAAEVTVDVTKSSQFLSALLISAVCANKPVKINTVGAHGMDYVYMTLDMMWSFGVTAQEKDGAFLVNGKYAPKKYDIEPDVSAACYFYAMNKILGTEVCVKGVMPHSMQGDTKFISLLKNFDGGKVNMSAFSDQALTLAAIAPYLSKPTEICGVAHIRGQECDRISAIYQNLTAMGVKCEEREDGVIIYPSAPRPAKIKTFGDHRVAMAFALTGLKADGIEIENSEVCAKTFPDYFTVLDGLCNDLTK